MLDTKMLEQKIDIHIAQQEKSSGELKSAMSDLASSIKELVVSNTRAEERHHSTTLRLAKAEENIDKLSEKFDKKFGPISERVSKNTMVVNVFWGGIAAMVAWLMRGLIGG